LVYQLCTRKDRKRAGEKQAAHNEETGKTGAKVTRVHKDFASFAKRARKIGDHIIEAEQKIAEETTMFAVAELVGATPIDVGTARSNWAVGLDRLPTMQRAAYSPYPSRWRPPYGSGGSMGDTRNRAGAVWSASAAIRGRKPEQDIYIGNDLPYITRLNQGHSRMAPAGFVEAAIQRARKRGREFAKEFIREGLKK
jgi:hypothetical protein